MLVTVKPREMRYSDESKVQLLYNDIYKGFHYYILNLGTHPTAYVEIPKEHVLYSMSYIDIEDSEYYIDVHGGLTYSSDSLRIGEDTSLKNSWFIGWDYAHLGDYLGYDLVKSTDKKWTTLEIIEECKKVIEQIEEF